MRSLIKIRVKLYRRTPRLRHHNHWSTLQLPCTVAWHRQWLFMPHIFMNASHVHPGHTNFAMSHDAKHARIVWRVRIERHGGSNNVSPSVSRVLHRLVKSYRVGERASTPPPSLPEHDMIPRNNATYVGGFPDNMDCCHLPM